MISISIQAKDAGELVEHMKELSRVFNTNQPSYSIHLGLKDLPVAKVETEEVPELAPDPKKSRARKAREEKRSEDKAAYVETILKDESPSTVVVTEFNEPAAVIATKEDAVKALVSITDKLGAKDGLVRAREVLARFQCARISELKEDQYPAFIGECYGVVERSPL